MGLLEKHHELWISKFLLFEIESRIMKLVWNIACPIICLLIWEPRRLGFQNFRDSVTLLMDMLWSKLLTLISISQIMSMKYLRMMRLFQNGGVNFSVYKQWSWNSMWTIWMMMILEWKVAALLLTRNIFHLKDYVVVSMMTTTMMVKIFKLKMSLNMMKNHLCQHMVLILLIVMKTTE